MTEVSDRTPGRFDTDVAVVGSGFGGSVAALRLTEKGYRVTVLEKGKRWRPEDFPSTNWNLPQVVLVPLGRLLRHLGAAPVARGPDPARRRRRRREPALRQHPLRATRSGLGRPPVEGPRGLACGHAGALRHRPPHAGLDRQPEVRASRRSPPPRGRAARPGSHLPADRRRHLLRRAGGRGRRSLLRRRGPAADRLHLLRRLHGRAAVRVRRTPSTRTTSTWPRSTAPASSPRPGSS